MPAKVRHLAYPLPLFLLLSLLMHGLFLSLFPMGIVTPPASAPQPIEVDLQKPQIAPLEPELEELPPVPPQERATPAKRLGPQTQVTPKETAPVGRDNFDRTSKAPSPAPTPVPLQPTDKPEVTPEPTPAPSLEQLTKVPQKTLERLARLPAETAEREQQKARRDVAPGDRVQLDMTEDVLISFYRRFKNHVLGAWNYPAISRQRNEQGRVVTRITVDKKGELVDLQLVDGSGYAALDEAALQALKRSAPYGPLSRHYPRPTHSFNVIFLYQRYNPLGR